MDIKDVMAKKTASRIETSIQLDGGIAQEIENLREEIRNAERGDIRLNRNPVAPGLKKQLGELVEKARDTEVTFIFQAIGRVAWDKMVTDYPPTDEDKELEKDAAWDLNRFPPAIIQAACIDPKMTAEEVQEIWDSTDWSQTELTKLFAAAWQANQETPNIPFDRLGIELMPPTEPKSVGAEIVESPEASS